MKRLFENGMIVTMDKERRIIERGYMLVEDDRIVEIGEGDYTGDRNGLSIEDARNRILLPGLINAHTHSYSHMVKGTTENIPLEIWMLYIMAEGTRMSADDHALSAALGSIEMLKSGTTTFLDHLAQDETGLGKVAEQYKKIGIRALLTPMYGDRAYRDSLPEANIGSELGGSPHGPKGKGTSWQDLIDMVESVIRNLSRPDEGVSIAVGPSGPQRCTDELLVQSMELAQKYNVPFHIHLLETKAQEVTADRLYGCSMVQHMKNLGILNDRVSLAHSVWVSESDIELIRESGATVVHNPSCNLALGSGIMPLIAMKEAGVPIALGTDGSNASGYQSVFESMKVSAMLSHVSTPDYTRWITASEVLEMATLGGARAVGMSEDIGSLEAGKKADFMVIRRRVTNFVPMNNPVRQLVYGRPDMYIDTVYVNGKKVYDGGKIVQVDEEAIYREAEERGVYLMKQLQDDYRKIEKELPQFYQMMMRVAKAKTKQTTIH